MHWWKFKFQKSWTLEIQTLKLTVRLQNVQFQVLMVNCLYWDKLKMNHRSYYNLPNSGFEADFLWKVSLNILNSGISLKIFTHEYGWYLELILVRKIPVKCWILVAYIGQNTHLMVLGMEPNLATCLLTTYLFTVFNQSKSLDSDNDPPSLEDSGLGIATLWLHAGSPCLGTIPSRYCWLGRDGFGKTLSFILAISLWWPLCLSLPELLRVRWDLETSTPL